MRKITWAIVWIIVKWWRKKAEMYEFPSETRKYYDLQKQLVRIKTEMQMSGKW